MGFSLCAMGYFVVRKLQLYLQQLSFYPRKMKYFFASIGAPYEKGEIFSARVST